MRQLKCQVDLILLFLWLTSDSRWVGGWVGGWMSSHQYDDAINGEAEAIINLETLSMV